MSLLLALAVGCDPQHGDLDDTGTTDPIDLDADGYPDWRTTDDPNVADCDDADAAVTPATEVYVPAGTFTRGQVGVENAEPVRAITLSAYCIDRTEVSNAAFVEMLTTREGEGASNVDDLGRPLFDVWDDDDDIPERLAIVDGSWSVQESYADHPVVEVWNWSAAYYCAWNGQSLPTEAQWEKAARGATDARSWPWGDDPPDCGRANYSYEEVIDGAPRLLACFGDTVPVDALPDGEGPTGIAGLAGNVAEWVSDWFDPDAYVDDPDTNPAGPAEGQLYNDGVGEWIARVDRGGNFQATTEWMNVSARFYEPEDATSNGVGFRCARALE